jgi:hypothetical protein
MVRVQYNEFAIGQPKLPQDISMRKRVAAILVLGAMLGCSSESSKPAPASKPQPKPAATITGNGAFYKCYIAARLWAQDAQPYRAESGITADSKGRDGKAGVWRAEFASPSLRGIRTFTWTGESISPDVQDTYSPTNTSTQVFNVQFLKVDTDKALETAQKHGGEKLLAEEPDTPVQYVLDWNRRENNLVWHVIYGTDRDSAKLRVAVDATTGGFLRVEK